MFSTFNAGTVMHNNTIVSVFHILLYFVINCVSFPIKNNNFSNVALENFFLVGQPFCTLSNIHANRADKSGILCTGTVDISPVAFRMPMIDTLSNKYNIKAILCNILRRYQYYYCRDNTALLMLVVCIIV